MYCGKCGSVLTETSHPAWLALILPESHFLKTPLMPPSERVSTESSAGSASSGSNFATLSLVLGTAGYLAGPLDAAGYALPYEPWPHLPAWNWTFAPGVVWLLLVSRLVLALMAAWGIEATL